jgi:EAL domain-containing protein (putative c-di-GMP-specific phosphodiesterase class I)
VEWSAKNRSGDVVIVSSMIDLAHGLGLQTLAEGVETPGEVAQLRVLGSELAQATTSRVRYQHRKSSRC